MPFDLDMWEQEFGGVETGETEDINNDSDVDYYPGQRGVLGDIVSLAGRAGISTLETLENAAEYFNLNDSTVDSASKLRQFKLFQPDIDEYIQRGWLKETPIGSVPSAVESMGPSLAVAGAGAATGAGVGMILGPGGAALGGIIGGTLASLGLMGTAEYQRTYEEATQAGLSDEEARSLASKNGMIEGLGESVGSWIGLSPLLKGVTSIAKKPVTTTLQGILKADFKAVGKELTKIYTEEQLTEFAQAGLQNYNLQQAGLSDMSTGEALAKTILPTMFMTGAFQVGTNAYQSSQKKALRNVLTHGTPEQKTQAIDIISKNLQQTDPEIANSFNIFGKMSVANGKDIDFNEDFAEFAEQLTIAHAQPITDSMILTGVGLEEAVAKKLETVSVQPIPQELMEYESYTPKLPKGFEERGLEEQLKQYQPEMPVGYDARVRAEEQEKAKEQEKVAKARAHLEERLARFAEPKTPAQVEAKAAIEEAIANLTTEGGEGAVAVTGPPTNEEMVAEAGLREMEGFTESREKKGTPDIRIPTPLKWTMDSTMENQKGQSDGIIGKIPGVKDTEYSIIHLGSDQYTVSRVKYGTEGQVVDNLGTFETREEAVVTVNKDAEDFLKTEAGTEWVGKKGQPRTAKFGENTYKIDKVGTVWKVLKNGEVFKNPANARGSWGKSLTTVQKAIEESEGFTRESKPVVVPPAKGEAKVSKETPVSPEEETTEDKLKRLPTRERWVAKFEGKPFSEQLQGAFRRQLETINSALTSGQIKEGSNVWKKMSRDQKDITAILKATQTGQPINLKEDTKVAKKIEAEPLVAKPKVEGGEKVTEAKPIEVEQGLGKAAPPAPKEMSTVGQTEVLTTDEQQLADLEAQADALLAQEEAALGAVPGDEINTGVPTETHAGEIVANQAKAGDELAKALMAKVGQDVLAEIPVVHNPKGRSQYDPKTNTIQLKGDESWIKMHEVIHGITVRQMEGNPKLAAEVQTLMDDTLASVPEGTFTPYEINSPAEFLGQMQTNPRLVTHMKAAGVGKLNLWQRFVEFVRKAIGLPQSRKTLLERALDITTRLAQAPAAESKSAALGGFQGVSSRLANQDTLNTAQAMENAGENAQDILSETGWVKLEDGDWRFFVPDKDINITAAGLGVIRQVTKGHDMPAFKAVELFKADLVQQAYPEVIGDLSVKFTNDPDGDLGSYNVHENLITLNLAPMNVRGFEHPSYIRKEVTETLVHELQHVIQFIEGFSKGGNSELNSELNISLLKNLVIKQANEMFPGSEFAEAVSEWLDESSIQDHVFDMEDFDIDLPYGFNRNNAIIDILNSLHETFPTEFEEIKQSDNEYNKELMRRFRYEGTNYEGAETPENAALDSETYRRLLGEMEARLASLFRTSTEDEFRQMFLMDKWAEEQEVGKPIVVPGLTETGLENSNVSREKAKKMSPEERRAYVIEQQEDEVKPSVMGGILQSAGKLGEQAKELAEKVMTPINDVLKVLDPRYAAMNRVAEGIRSRNDKQDTVALKPLIDGIHRMTPADRKVFKAGWVNKQDRPLLDELIKKYGLQKEWKVWQDFLDNSEKIMIKHGVVSSADLIEGYLPRAVADPRGLYNALQGADLAEFEQQIAHQKAKVEKAGGKWNPRMEEEYIAQIVSNNRYKSIPLPGFAKDRSIGHVPTEMLKFYSDPVETMLAHVLKVNEQIYQRTITGKSNRAKKLQELRRHEKTLRVAKPESKEWQNAFERSRQLAEEVYDVDEDARVTLAQAIMEDKKLSADQKQKVLRQFEARFNQMGTHGIVHWAKNVGLMMTIGNPLSAITQLGDQGLNLADNGINGIAGVAAAFSRNNRIIDQFDVENAVKDFISDSSSSNNLSKLLKYSGLSYMDTFGKESYMQGAMRRFAKMDFNTFKQKMGVYEEFLEGAERGNALGEAYTSMQAGKPNNNAALLLFAELSGVQPTTLSETSAQFLQGGNARIFYMLKQFALRSLSASITRAREEFNAGRPVQGILRAASLIGILGLAGAGTDEIKNILMGRESEDLPDAVISNLMQILMVNRYAVETGISRGKVLENILVNNFMLPPVKAADAIVRDVVSTAQGDFSYRTMSYVPMLGRLAFEYTPQGAEAEIKRQRLYILDKIAAGESPGKLRGDINRVNRQITSGMDVDRITSRTIKAARKRNK